MIDLTITQRQAIQIFKKYGPTLSYVQNYNAFGVAGTHNIIQVNTINTLVKKGVLKATKYKRRGEKRKKVLFEVMLLPEFQ